MDDHLVALGGGWALRRDFAVRSAGFPVAGLEVFGHHDEPARLREVALDPAFREAVTWQNRDVLASLDGLLVAGGAPSKERRREAVVARYWQRYCSKNDTIGFFGGLAWGELRNDGPALAQRSRGGGGDAPHALPAAPGNDQTPGIEAEQSGQRPARRRFRTTR